MPCLSDVEAKHICTIEFSTTAFALPEEQGSDNLTTAFAFRIHQLPRHRLVVSTPLNDAPPGASLPLRVDDNIWWLLLRMHVSLCCQRWYDERGGRGGRVWPAEEVRTLTTLVHLVISDVQAETETGAPRVVVPWAEFREKCEAVGVWDAGLPRGPRMRLREVEGCAFANGWEAEARVWSDW